MRSDRTRSVIGWIGVALNLIVALMWAVWGTLEAFHEGWYHRSIWVNLAWLLAYTLGMWIAIFLGIAAVRWPRWGAWVYGIVWLAAGTSVLAMLLPGSRGVALFFALALGGFGGLVALLLGFGRPHPARLAVRLTWLLPVALSLILAVEPAYRVATRHDDGYRGERLVVGSEVQLVWAPRGPGWPDKGTSWDDAVRAARYLSPDGTKLMEAPQDVWRLPTVHEVVGSLTRGGKNAGGFWNPSDRVATYRGKPDKESPLWDPYSEVIYYWTSDDFSGEAFFVVYNGGVYSAPKTGGMGTRSFRAVREPRPEDWNARLRGG